MRGMEGRACAICRGAVADDPRAEGFPFCSERCRLIDLGNWLGERYRIASRSEAEEEDGSAPPVSAGMAATKGELPS